MFHDPRTRAIDAPVLEPYDDRFEVSVGGVGGGSPAKIKVTDEGDKARPWGLETYATLGFALARKGFNLRISGGASVSGGNQKTSEKVGEAATESFEPRADDAIRDGHGVRGFNFGRSSALYFAPLAEADALILLKNNQRVRLRFGSIPQGLNVWNFRVITPVTDLVYAHLVHTFLNASAGYFIERERGNFSISANYRHHRTDGDLALFESTGNVDFYQGWQAGLLVYAGAHWQKPSAGLNEESGYDVRPGRLSAFGGSFSIQSPHEYFRFGFAAGTLRGVDQGLDPLTQTWEKMPRSHNLGTVFAIGKVPLPKGEILAKVAPYLGAQSFVRTPGDAPTVERKFPLEVILQYDLEIEKDGPRGSSDLDLGLALVYLRDDQRLFQSDGTALKNVNHLFVGAIELHFGGSYKIRRPKKQAPSENVARALPIRDLPPTAPHLVPKKIDVPLQANHVSPRLRPNPFNAVRF